MNGEKENKKSATKCELPAGIRPQVNGEWCHMWDFSLRLWWIQDSKKKKIFFLPKTKLFPPDEILCNRPKESKNSLFLSEIEKVNLPPSQCRENKTKTSWLIDKKILFFIENFSRLNETEVSVSFCIFKLTLNWWKDHCTHLRFIIYYIWSAIRLVDVLFYQLYGAVSAFETLLAHRFQMLGFYST